MDKPLEDLWVCTRPGMYAHTTYTLWWLCSVKAGVQVLKEVEPGLLIALGGGAVIG